MARTRRCLGVDISNTHIHIADVETIPEGIRIRKMLSTPLPEFEAGDFDDPKKRQEAYTQLFKQLSKQEKLAGAPAVFAVSGNYFFVRKLTLPFASTERLEKIIQFESRQQIPLPPEKTVRQYQVFPKPEEKEAEVVLAAAKRDNIQDFMKIVEWSGLKARSLSVSSLALFNFYAFLQGGIPEPVQKERKKNSAKGLKLPLPLLKKKKSADTAAAEQPDPSAVNPAIGAAAETEAEEIGLDVATAEGYEEVKAYLNLGPRTLDICIARISKDSKVLGFPRSVPLLGPNKEVFKALKRRFDLESEKDAQAILESNNVAALTFDFDPEQDPSLNLEASEVISEVLDAMVSEVRRSLDFYISQPDGMAVDSVVLSGPLARIRNVASFFEEKLGLPAEVLSIESAKGVKIEGVSSEEIPPYVIAIGLALEGLNRGVITQVNFLPDDIKTLQEFKSKYILLSAVTVFLVGTIYLGAQLGKQSVMIYREQAIALENEINVNQPIVNRTKGAIEARKKLAEKYASIYKALPPQRNMPLEILAVVQQQKPPNVFVRTFYVNPFGEMHIIGATESSDSVVQFVDNMKNNMTKYYDTEKKDDAPHIVRTTQGPIAEFGNRVGVEFDISMRVKGMGSILQTPTPTPTPATGGPGFIPGAGRGLMYPGI